MQEYEQCVEETASSRRWEEVRKVRGHARESGFDLKAQRAVKHCKQRVL